MNLEPGVLQINLDDIIPNRFQPRIAFDEQGLKELSDSIKEHGIIQPLVLRKLGNKYEIIAGERRYKAATMAGLTTVPAVISNVDDNKSAEVALVENIQRRDLTPIEEAKSYKTLLDKGYLTQEQLAKKMGISQPAVANKLRLLNLDDEVQQALLAEKISERHARSLLQIQDKNEQRNWLKRVINERLTVRQLDQEIKKMYDSTDEEDDIPTISLTPSIEDIKANAQDINPVIKPKNIQNMMMPESIMTEHSDALPRDIFSDPIVMKKQEQEEINPVSKEPENKFFNFTEEQPANMEMTELDTPNIFSKNNDLEVIDMPNLNPQPKDETLDDFIKPNPETLNTPFETNPNNKFFTALNDYPEPDVLTPQKEELIIDPMSQVDRLDPVFQEKLITEQETKLTDAINETRKLVDTLKEKGCNIVSEELDLQDHYEFIIKIKK